jgi:hypothetical protein
MIDKSKSGVGPDYARYKLSDLHSALESIDESLYPERTEAIRKRIIMLTEQEAARQKGHILQIQEMRDSKEDNEHVFYVVDFLSAKMVAMFFGNLLTTCLFVYEYLSSSGVEYFLLSLVMICLLIVALEIINGQTELSFTRSYLKVTQKGFRILRRDKQIPMDDILNLEQVITTTSAKGIPIRSFYLKAQLKNGESVRLTNVKDEAEGAKIVELVNQVIGKKVKS